MDIDKIAALVSEILPEVSNPSGLDYKNPESCAYKRNTLYKVSIPKESEQRLIELLGKQPELKQFDGGNASNSPTGMQSVRLKDFSQWILAQSRFREPKSVVTQLKRFVTKNTTLCTEVVVFWGIHPADTYEVYDGIKLVPLNLLPDSVPKDKLMGVPEYIHPVANPYGLKPSPRAALVQEFEHGPILRLPGDFRQSNKDKSRRQLMEEIVNLLAVFDIRPVYPVSHWYQIDENTPVIGRVGGGGGLSAPFRHLLKIKLPPRNYEAASLQSFIKHYMELEPEIKDQLRTPLVRLNSAILWHTSNDFYNAAIDLRTALESLLTYDLEHDAPIAFNIRLRGALLLGGESKVKKWNFERLKLLYIICSQAVHKGKVQMTYTYITIDDVKERKSTYDVLAEGFELCADLVKKIIADGKFPDWNKLVIGNED